MEIPVPLFLLKIFPKSYRYFLVDIVKIFVFQLSKFLLIIGDSNVRLSDEPNRFKVIGDPIFNLVLKETYFFFLLIEVCTQISNEFTSYKKKEKKQNVK